MNTTKTKVESLCTNKAFEDLVGAVADRFQTAHSLGGVFIG